MWTGLHSEWRVGNYTAFPSIFSPRTYGLEWDFWLQTAGNSPCTGKSKKENTSWCRTSALGKHAKDTITDKQESFWPCAECFIFLFCPVRSLSQHEECPPLTAFGSLLVGLPFTGSGWSVSIDSSSPRCTQVERLAFPSPEARLNFLEQAYAELWLPPIYMENLVWSIN